MPDVDATVTEQVSLTKESFKVPAEKSVMTDLEIHAPDMKGKFMPIEFLSIKRQMKFRV